MLLGRDLRV